MMKLAFSTNAFVRYSVFKAIEKIAEIGYEGVELVADIPHLYIYSITESDMKKLKETIARSHIQVANINANTARGYYGKIFWDPLFEPSIANPDITVRKWRIDYTKRCIDLAHSLGCFNVSITSGRMIPGVPLSESMDILRESLREILVHAEERDVRIGLEPEPGLLIEYSSELASLLAEMNSPLLGANLDLGHSHVLGEDPEEVIRTFSEKIFHVHAEDIRSRKHYHLIPGSGDMDFERLFSDLDKYSYGGFVTVELYTYPYQADEAARKAFGYLKGLAFWESARV
ncbi:MAG TPA: sugar phosphate isomerase/epimerase family protein [Dissulfurispiraceae bacterium]